MNVSLLRATECSKFLCTPETLALVKRLKDDVHELDIFLVQPLNDMLKGGSKHFPFDVKYEGVKRDPILVLHSSGSTGKCGLILNIMNMSMTVFKGLQNL